jgi:hypothetical protein
MPESRTPRVPAHPGQHSMVVVRALLPGIFDLSRYFQGCEASWEDEGKGGKEEQA